MVRSEIPTLVRSSQCAPVAQLDRASDYGSEGWEFESLRARKQKRTGICPSFFCSLLSSLLALHLVPVSLARVNRDLNPAIPRPALLSVVRLDRLRFSSARRLKPRRGNSKRLQIRTRRL